MIKIIDALKRSIFNIYNDITLEIAGYVAYMAFLALFPFFILLMMLAGYIGTTHVATTALSEIYKILPQEVVKEISPIVSEVTQHSPQGGYIIIVILTILWISSSGVEAVRMGLNHVYKLKENRSFVFRRSQSLIFVLVGSISFFMGIGILIIIPFLLELWHMIEVHLPNFPQLPAYFFETTFNVIRVLIAYSAVLIWFTTSYKWLPNHQVDLVKCIPGATIASILWILAVGLFSVYIRSFARYNIYYGSLGGVIVTLLFFQISASIFLFGGQINKELEK